MKNLVSLLMLVTLVIANARNPPKSQQGMLQDVHGLACKNDDMLEASNMLQDLQELVGLNFDMVVASDSSCNFTIVSEAIAVTPVLSSSRFTIKIKVRIYQQNVVVPSNKTNLFLVGDERGITIITATKNAHEGLEALGTTTIGKFIYVYTYKLREYMTFESNGIIF